MGVAVTVRDLPEEVRDELAARARRDGKSLQEFLKGMLIQTAFRPTPDEVIARARTRVVATQSSLTAEEILTARDVDRR